MPSIHFSNFNIDKETIYFFYIGELKNYGLNSFLKEALSRIYHKKVDFIAIVPDILEQYNYENIIVIHPLVQAHKKQYKSNVSFRMSAPEFMKAVSENPEIRSLIDQVIKQQSELFLYMYESLVEMTLDEIPGVSILGPDKLLAKKANNKILQMTGLQDVVPVVEFKICDGYDELLDTCNYLWNTWSEGIFVTKEYSAAGINSIIAHCIKDVIDKFKNQDVRYLITRFMPHTHDPTVLGVVANHEQIYIAGVADQRIENGNQFTGSTFPSVLSDDLQSQLIDQTRKVGFWLAEQGYRGVYGCDYIITHDNDIRFLEINARKQGTTLEFCCTLEQTLPKGSPILPELEYWAVRHGQMPEHAIEMKENKRNIHWGTYNYKVHQNVKTHAYIPQAVRERESFDQVAKNQLNKDYSILEHIGSNFLVIKGTFLARVIALGHDHQSVSQGIEQGCKTIELTFNNTTNTENNYAKY